VVSVLLPVVTEDVETSTDVSGLLIGARARLEALRDYLNRFDFDLVAAMSATSVARELALDELAGTGVILARLTVLIEQTDPDDERRQFEVIRAENMAILARLGGEIDKARASQPRSDAEGIGVLPVPLHPVGTALREHANAELGVVEK
jgi:hypothetical protein